MCSDFLVTLVCAVIIARLLLIEWSDQDIKARNRNIPLKIADIIFLGNQFYRLRIRAMSSTFSGRFFYK
jgi:hypothetical protein